MARVETLEFLRSVLPDKGVYCGLIIEGQKRRQFFCDTVEQLAETLVAHDQQGRTAYHACASFKTAGSRKTENVAWVKAFWLDIDCGPDKAYADARSAAVALGNFCRVAGLPEPLLVGSGGGLHAYWTLRAAIPYTKWKPQADALKKLCLTYGLIIDPVRTSDAASVLRPPGTHNRKHGVTLVQQLTNGAAAVLKSGFAGLQQDGPGLPQEHTPRAVVAISPRGSILERCLAGTEPTYAPVDANRIADLCAQLSGFRKSGNIPEPYYFASVGVTAYCEDGDRITHEWAARDYPKYSYDEVERRIARVRTLSGATTCAKFDAVNPGVCPKCPFYKQINSPVSLGRNVSLPRHNEGKSDTTLPRVSDGSEKLPALKPPFAWSTHDQLIFQSETREEKINTIVVNEPLYLEAVQAGELERTSYSYLFRHRLPHEGWKYVAIDAGAMFAGAGISVLADKGVIIHDSKLFMQYVRAAVSEFHQTTDTGTRYEQFGWKGNHFLCGRYLYTPAGKITVIGAKELAKRAEYLGPVKGGSLIAWTEAADSLFADQRAALGTMVLASLGAVFMRRLSTDNGGCIVHVVSRQSGGGKSTSLQGAFTAWGQERALKLVTDDTKVSKPIVMGTVANLPVIYDELKDKDREVIRKFVEMFSDGRDRLRGTADGGIRHQLAEWCTLLLSAANESLINKVETRGVDAPGFRILELPTEPQDFDKTRGDQLKRILDANAGWAGDKFLQYIVNPDVLATVDEMLNKWVADIWATTKLEPAHRFRVRAVACILTAGVIANHLDILHFDIERIYKYLMEILTEGHKDSGQVTKRTTLELAQEALADFLNQHQGQVLVVPEAWQAGKKLVKLSDPRGAVCVRYEIGSRRLYIADSVFRDWCDKFDIDGKGVVKELRQIGVVTDPKRRITLTGGTDMPGAQGIAIEINTQHPMISNVVATVAPNKYTSAVS